MSRHRKLTETTAEARTAGLALAARLILGGLFILSGFSKAVYPPEAFAAALEAYKLFPDALMMPIAQIMPWIELLAGVFLVAGCWLRPATWTLVGLLAGFEVVLLSVVGRGIDVPSCGCYGAYGPHFTPHQAVIFDMFLGCMAFLILTEDRHRFTLDAWIEKGQ
jgi:uncharacterized membrane protein YphA (DoxX/SURF4 family)